MSVPVQYPRFRRPDLHIHIPLKGVFYNVSSVCPHIRSDVVPPTHDMNDIMSSLSTQEIVVFGAFWIFGLGLLSLRNRNSSLLWTVSQVPGSIQSSQLVLSHQVLRTTCNIDSVIATFCCRDH